MDHKFTVEYKPFTDTIKELTILFLLCDSPSRILPEINYSKLKVDADFKYNKKKFILKIKTNGYFTEDSEEDLFYEYEDMMENIYPFHEFIFISFSGGGILTNLGTDKESADKLMRCYNTAMYLSEICSMRSMFNKEMENLPIFFYPFSDDLKIILIFERLQTEKEMINCNVEEFSLLNLQMMHEKKVLNRFLKFRHNYMRERDLKIEKNNDEKIMLGLESKIEKNLKELISQADSLRYVRSNCEGLSYCLRIEKLFIKEQRSFMTELSKIKLSFREEILNEKSIDYTDEIKENEERKEKATERGIIIRKRIKDQSQTNLILPIIEFNEQSSRDKEISDCFKEERNRVDKILNNEIDEKEEINELGNNNSCNKKKSENGVEIGVEILIKDNSEIKKIMESRKFEYFFEFEEERPSSQYGIAVNNEDMNRSWHRDDERPILLFERKDYSDSIYELKKSDEMNERIGIYCDFEDFTGLGEVHIKQLLNREKLTMIRDSIIEEKNNEKMFILFVNYRKIRKDMVKIACYHNKFNILYHILNQFDMKFKFFKELSTITFRNNYEKTYNVLRFFYDLKGEQMIEMINVHGKFNCFKIS